MLGREAEADETVGQLALGLFSDEFVAGAAAPKINAADLEKFAGGTAEELDQSGRVSTLRGLAGDPQEEFLKGIVGVGKVPAFRGRRRIASDRVQGVTACRHKVFTILTSD